MNMSRGTGFVELYIKPFALKNYDWGVLAEGIHHQTRTKEDHVKLIKP